MPIAGLESFVLGLEPCPIWFQEAIKMGEVRLINNFMGIEGAMIFSGEEKRYAYRGDLLGLCGDRIHIVSRI